MNRTAGDGWASARIEASGSAGKCNIYIGSGLLDEAGRLILTAHPGRRYAVISDSRVADLYADRVLASLSESGGAAALFKCAAGEWNKTRETWGDLTDGMLRAGFGRESVVVAVGGGVVGDVAGFVAATYLGGVPVVQIPTTLLAMLDSSIGGRTGVDTSAGKNLVGTLHQPSLVISDPALLTTLPDPQLFSGLAEAFKHGLILDAEYFEQLARAVDDVARREPQRLVELITRSVKIKAEVVERGERDAAYRRVLDFGHTIAHVQEEIAGYGWLHGEAVAAGMVLEAAIGEALGVTEAGTAERIREVMMRSRLPVELDSDVEPEHFFKVLEVAEMREGGVRYTLLAGIGRVAGSPEQGWTHGVPKELVRSVVFG